MAQQREADDQRLREMVSVLLSLTQNEAITFEQDPGQIIIRR